MEKERENSEGSLKAEIDHLVQQCETLHHNIKDYEQQKQESKKVSEDNTQIH